MAGALLYKSPGNSNEQPEEVTHRQNSEELLYVHSLSFYKLVYDMAIIKEKKMNYFYVCKKTIGNQCSSTSPKHSDLMDNHHRDHKTGKSARDDTQVTLEEHTDWARTGQK